MAQRSDKQMSIDPTISRLLDSNVGNILKSGGRVKGSELSIADQQALGIRPDQNVKLSRQILAQLQDAVNTAPVSPVMPRIDRVTGQPITPIANLNQVVSPTAIPAPATGMKETVVDPSSVISGGLGEMLTRLQNELRSPLRDLQRSVPVLRLLDDLNTPSTLATGDISALQRIFNPEGRKRTMSDLTKATKQIVPFETLEQRAIKELSKKYPELAEQTDKQGLKKFAGTGEFRINGVRFKIRKSGDVVRLG